MSVFDEKDLVVYKNDKKKIMSGGYEVKSLLLNDNISAVSTENNGKVGGSVSSLFSHLAIPAGLLMVNEAHKVANYDNTYINEMYDISLHDRLLQHVNPTSRKMYNKRTRRANNISTKKSRKNKQ
jgi:hypothetical protein